MLDGSLGSIGEESAGASFLRRAEHLQCILREAQVIVD
jgi:phosphoglucomutase